ncbi:MAG: hypothetical protein VX821_02720, partial [Verrucomicrobiota bacterium]|nr:hypothetical protein [Verrucomicrobiota bacterium]
TPARTQRNEVAPNRRVFLLAGFGLASDSGIFALTSFDSVIDGLSASPGSSRNLIQFFPSQQTSSFS